MAKISKKQIVSTLRTYDVNKICVLYKNLFGTVPINVRHPYDSESTYTCLDGFELYQWAKNFATSEKMERQLFGGTETQRGGGMGVMYPTRATPDRVFC